MSHKDHWDILLFKSSLIIKQLQTYTQHFENFTQWPSIHNYIDIFHQHKLDVTPVPQSVSIDSFEDQYEPRIYLKKELQTRTENWHDFFNALIWLKFPITKKTLNKLHYSEAKNRVKGSNRSTLENRITQFDECGAVIITNDKKLLDLIRNHQWHELFINQKEQFENNIQCIVFGHAIFEKSISPYIGMTCHCILLEDSALLEQIRSKTPDELDKKLSDLWLNGIANHPVKFSAFPILGIPGLWPEQNAEFYSNHKYFR